MHIDCVFFDVGNTLIYPQPPVGEVYAAALRRRGIEVSAAQMAESFARAWQTLRRRRNNLEPPYGNTEEQARRWWQEVVRVSYMPFEPVGGIGPIFEELWEHFASPVHWRVHDDVFPTLKTLRRQGKRLGLISNWDLRLPLILEGQGVLGALDTATISFQVGVEKPSPQIFCRALAQCEARAERACHVGDSMEADIQGARGAGLAAVWLRREGAPRDGEPGVRVIRTLAELPPILG